MIQSLKVPSGFDQIFLEPIDLPFLSHNTPTPEPPVRCCTLHRTLRSSLDVWEYTPGEFDWQVDADQSACVISGSAEVDLADGRFICLEPGTAIFLPRGLHGHWVIKETLRTVAVRGS